MQSIMLIIHVALAIGVIGLVLIQHGKGADAGAAFGSGASSTVFGSRGSASFMTRLTTILAALFFVSSLVLFYLAANRDRGSDSVTDLLPSSVPAAVQDSANDAAQATDSDLPAKPEAPAATTESDLPATPEVPAATTESDLPATNSPATTGDSSGESSSTGAGD